MNALELAYLLHSSAGIPKGIVKREAAAMLLSQAKEIERLRGALKKIALWPGIHGDTASAALEGK